MLLAHTCHAAHEGTPDISILHGSGLRSPVPSRQALMQSAH